MKCIIFSRVSTDRQMLEAQTEEIRKRAEHIGYKQSEHVLIEYKESAIKKKADEREGIIKLKEVIQSDPSIDCLIIWELSRIGRRADVIFEVRDFLIEHHIRWICMKPEMEILGEGGKITPTTNLMLGVFTTFTENEMIIKKERFKRGKADAKAKGLYFGGPIVYGYKVNGKHYIIDEPAATMVKYVFDEITRSKRTAYDISKECYETAKFGILTMRQCISKVKHILGKEEYVGTKAYPQIITRTQFNEAQRLMNDRFAPKRSFQHLYYCQGIIYDKLTGHMLTPQWNDAIYSNKYRDEHGITSSISINIVDSLAFAVAHLHMRKFGSATKNEAIHQMKRHMVEVNKKKNVANRRRAELQDKIDRIEIRVINGKLSDTLANKLEKEAEDEIKHQTNLIDQYTAQLQDCIDTINRYKQDIAQVTFNEIMDDTAKKNIVRTSIKRIDVAKKSKYLSDIAFTFDDYSTATYSVNSRTKTAIDEQGKEFEYNLDIRISRTRKIRRPNHTENA